MKVSIIGRIGYDLYARETGVGLAAVESFSRYLGGSSANLAVGLTRQGASCRILSCLGTDALSDYLLHYLECEGVDVSQVQRRAGWLPSLCFTEVSPPDRFPQVFYRDRAADTQFTLDDEIHPRLIAESVMLVSNGTSLCASPSRESTLRALELAREAGVRTVLDVDYRAMSWSDPREAALYVRLALPWTEILIGNPEELCLVSGCADLESAVQFLRSRGVPLLVAKLGAAGVRAFSQEQSLEIAPVPVAVGSTIGAGDGFAAGFLAALLRGATLDEALRRGNASAALVVGQTMCSEAMPRSAEIDALLRAHPEIVPRQCKPFR